MQEVSKYILNTLIFCILLLFITLFFPLYFSKNSPAVWFKTNLYITDLLLKPPSLCVLGFHYAVCDELDINFTYYVSGNQYNCSINISDNVQEVYNFYSIKNITYIEGYYSRITHDCRELYYEPFFAIGFLLLNLITILICVSWIYKKCKKYKTRHYDRNIEVLLAEPRAII